MVDPGSARISRYSKTAKVQRLPIEPISQASADIMADLITGETVEEARRLAELFLAMIRGEKLSEEDLEDLDEAAQLQDISHMPARVKCAELAWRTLDGMLEGQANQ